MKRSIPTGILFLLALSGPAFADWQISEINFYPPEGEAQWIELVNNFSEPARLDGIRIKGDRRDWEIPEGQSNIPHGGLAVVYFDGRKGSAVDEKSGALVIHSPKRNPFGGPQKGWCALYEKKDVMSKPESPEGVELEVLDYSKDQSLKRQFEPLLALQEATRKAQEPKVVGQKEEMVDFLAWGDKPGKIGQEAMWKNLWSGEGVFFHTDPAPEKMVVGPIEPGTYFDCRGKTIARVKQGGWSTMQLDEVSPGRPNVLKLRPPGIMSPQNGSHILGQPTFWWTGGVVDIDLALDEDFRQIVRQWRGIEGENQLRPDPPLDDHKVYWWRIRRVGENGEVSEWSEATKFIIGHPRVDNKQDKK